MKNPIRPEFMAAFRGKLERLDLDRVENVVGDIEDLGGFDEIKYADLPKEIPEVVRHQIVAKSKQMQHLGDEIQCMLEQLGTVSEKIYDAKERQWEKDQVRCMTCHQILPKRKR